MVKLRKYGERHFMCEILPGRYIIRRICIDRYFSVLNFIENDLPLDKMITIFNKKSKLADIQIHQIKKSEAFVSIFVLPHNFEKLNDNLMNEGLNIENQDKTIKIKLHHLKKYKLPNGKLYFYGEIKI